MSGRRARPRDGQARSTSPAAVPGDRLDLLYPPGALDLPVAPSVAAPRKPSPPRERSNPDPLLYRDYYGQSILTELPVTGHEERVAVIDKAWPHSLNDIMLLVASDQHRRTHVAETPDAVLARLLEGATTYVTLAADELTAARFDLTGGRVTIGWNYDSTSDRDGGQWWDKTMHWHCNLYPRQTQESVKSLRLGDITDLSVRHSLVDPFSYLAQQVLREALGHDLRRLGVGPALAATPTSDAELGHPVGLKVPLPGWDYLATEECRDLLRLLHSRVTGAYDEVLAAFTEVTPSMSAGSRIWERPRLRSAQQTADRLSRISWLHSTTASKLSLAHSLLRDVSPRQMQTLRENRTLANRFLTLSGASYNITFMSVDGAGPGFRNSERVLLVLQPKVFSYIGHTPALGSAVASIINRRIGPLMGTDLLEHRWSLHSEFIRRAAATEEQGRRPE